jgi:excisionase family DNA binding protein
MVERLLSPHDICNLLSIKKSTLYSWTSRGLIPYVRVNGLLRFRESAIEPWLKLKERGVNISNIERILRGAEKQREDG